jgi:hypothetical protein
LGFTAFSLGVIMLAIIHARVTAFSKEKRTGFTNGKTVILLKWIF